LSSLRIAISATGFRTPYSAAGLRVERHRDHFEPTTPDEEWLAVVGAKRWVAITHDSRIRYKPNELEAVIRHNVRLLVIVGKAPFPELAKNFVATMPKIDRFLAGHIPPLIAKVYRPSQGALKINANAGGEVSLWYSRQASTYAGTFR
jgi:hypothetical protein